MGSSRFTVEYIKKNYTFLASCSLSTTLERFKVVLTDYTELTNPLPVIEVRGRQVQLTPLRNEAEQVRGLLELSALGRAALTVGLGEDWSAYTGPLQHFSIGGHILGDEPLNWPSPVKLKGLPPPIQTAGNFVLQQEAIYIRCVEETDRAISVQIYWHNTIPEAAGYAMQLFNTITSREAWQNYGAAFELRDQQAQPLLATPGPGVLERTGLGRSLSASGEISDPGLSVATFEAWLIGTVRLLSGGASGKPYKAGVLVLGHVHGVDRDRVGGRTLLVGGTYRYAEIGDEETGYDTLRDLITVEVHPRADGRGVHLSMACNDPGAAPHFAALVDKARALNPDTNTLSEDYASSTAQATTQTWQEALEQLGADVKQRPQVGNRYRFTRAERKTIHALWKVAENELFSLAYFLIKVQEYSGEEVNENSFRGWK